MSTNDSAIAMILGGMSAAQSSWPAGLVGEPALGAHLVTPRGGYTHHGIYVGDGRVIHYAGFASSWHAGPVEEVTVCEFAFGHWVSIVGHSQARYSAQQVVQRARSRLGECDFRLLSNNCEHFCNWCVSGCHRSEQVERLRVGFCVTQHAVQEHCPHLTALLKPAAL